jgi:hypothetical protein
MAEFAQEQNPLLLIAGGAATVAQGAQSYKAGKEEKKFLYEQAAEIEQQRRFSEREATEEQLALARESDLAVGQAKAQTAKAGVRQGGSATRRRTAIALKYGREIGRVGRFSVERSRQSRFQQRVLTKRGRAAQRAGKWKLYTSLLTGGARVGAGLYKSGVFSNDNGGMIKPGTGGYKGNPYFL